MKDKNMPICTALLHDLRRKHCNLASVARAVGVSRQRLYAMLSGRCIMKIGDFIAICEAVGVKPSEVLKGAPKRQYRFIAVDFDGTLVAHQFPAIGAPNLNVMAFIRNHAARGTKIILHTCRSGEHLDKAVNWCREQNVPIHAVNENPWVDFGAQKVYADIYLDDRAVNVREIKD